ncbi:hypothetical protein [Microbacterium sp. G2-8]|uniref:hypothetical protein n=1 Tax=Microbacterium sp. G2-8 TaxID=2842454 RepID=UPI001C88F9FB|nr:hypothetical protein [Microbacterium sp. G2-8]
MTMPWTDVSAVAEQATDIAEMDPAARESALRGIAQQQLAEHSETGVRKAAERVGLDPAAAQIVEESQSLATTEGRGEALRELGVHVSGGLADRYGVHDEEAERLLEASKALRTPEGRAQVMSQYVSELTGDLTLRASDRYGSLAERREAIEKLLSTGPARSSLENRAGVGLVVGSVVALLVLIGVLIGGVALLDALADGGADATGTVIEDLDATRPDAASFVATPGSA